MQPPRRTFLQKLSAPLDWTMRESFVSEGRSAPEGSLMTPEIDPGAY